MSVEVNNEKRKRTNRDLSVMVYGNLMYSITMLYF